jgi:hypothetical protein
MPSPDVRRDCRDFGPLDLHPVDLLMDRAAQPGDRFVVHADEGNGQIGHRSAQVYDGQPRTAHRPGQCQMVTCRMEPMILDRRPCCRGRPRKVQKFWRNV